MVWIERRVDRNNNIASRLNCKISDIASRAYQILLFKFMDGSDTGGRGFFVLMHRLFRILKIARFPSPIITNNSGYV